MAEGGEKTEQASPKKREDERKKGNIFMSKDVITIASLIVSFYAFGAFISSFREQITLNYSVQMQRIVDLPTLHGEEIMQIYREFLMIFVTTAIPPMLIIAVTVLAATFAQTRFLVSYEQIKFKFERMSPLRGLKRMFSLRSLVELLKSIIKIVVIIWLLYRNIMGTIYQASNMIDWDLNQALAFMGEEILSLAVTVTVAFGAIAAVDFLYQRWEYEKGIRMTKQEVKDEYKQMEGNPEIKSARRQKQREYAQRRMMQQVKEADVIVRNPTHFAVALKYKIGTDPAPVVLAKGADLIAQKIVEEGEKHGVVLVENPPLARGLYDTADIMGYIPAEFFQPVAELLAWIYTAKEQGKDPAQMASAPGSF